MLLFYPQKNGTVFEWRGGEYLYAALNSVMGKNI
jgi:hypothetical protein